MIALKDIASSDYFSVNHHASLKEAMEHMQKNPDGSVVLVENRKPIAIVTESDIVNALTQEIDLNSKAFLLATKPVISANENRPIEFAFNFLSEHNIRRVVLVDNQGNFSGVVLQEELFDYLEDEVFKVDLKIADILKTSHELISVDEDASLHKALVMMQKHHIGSVIVMKQQYYAGILTEKDILKLTYLEVSLNDAISLYMSTPIITATKEAYVTDVIALMKGKHIRRIAIEDADAKLVGILTNRDILQHVKGNYSRMLQIKIKHAQEIMDFLPEAIVEIFDSNAQQVVHWMNKKAKDFFGNNLIDKDLTTIFSAYDWQKIYKQLQEHASIFDERVSIGYLTFEVSGTLSKNLNSRYIKLIFKDVTEHEETKRKLQVEIDRQIEKRLENEYLLMQQSKLATMGEMIGHIAHQWRQPLAQMGGIFMNLESAHAFEELTPEYLKQNMKKGNELLKYMSRTIDDFRHFFEPNCNKKSFDIDQYIQIAINIIQASLTFHHITLKVKSPKNPVFINGYPSEFSQVILNLLDNAKDILLERQIKNPKIFIETFVENEKVIVSVSDNAGGVDENIINNIFDIYFTTKAKRGGSGLGLYMSKLIIESKGMGKIDVTNSKRGAAFSIYLQKE
jgi:signal transduction histidine kinase